MLATKVNSLSALPPIPTKNNQRRDTAPTEVGSKVAFVSFDPDTNVSSLYHVNVIGTIANCNSKGLWVMLDHLLYNLSFVVWRASIHNNAVALLNHFCKLL
jgi:hypothetical protein